MKNMRIFSVLVSLAAACSCQTTQAGTVSFGSESNTFSMEFVEIGSPGNLDDMTGSPGTAGAVDYTYQMGTFEVSEDMITKYNANFGTANCTFYSKSTKCFERLTTKYSVLIR